MVRGTALSKLQPAPLPEVEAAGPFSERLDSITINEIMPDARGVARAS